TVSSQSPSSTASLFTSAMYSPCDFAYAAFTPAAKPMFATLLSCTITSAGRTVCASIESRHWRNISPPPMSTMMAETSVMAHPVEVHRPGQAAQHDASFPVDVHRYDVVRVRRRGRQSERARADLDRRAAFGRVPKMRRAALGQE